MSAKQTQILQIFELYMTALVIHQLWCFPFFLNNIFSVHFEGVVGRTSTISSLIVLILQPTTSGHFTRTFLTSFVSSLQLLVWLFVFLVTEKALK